MKKHYVIALIVCFILVVASFVACSDTTIADKDTCIVSIPNGFELWADENVLCEKIDYNSNSNDATTYYKVAKNAEIFIVNFKPYSFDNSSNVKGSVVVGFNVNGKVYAYSPILSNDISFICQNDTDVMPLYQQYESVGLIAFVGDNESILRDYVLQVDKCFNADGTINEIKNFYYIVKQQNRWQTNFEIVDTNASTDETKYIVNSVITNDSQKMICCALYRYNQTEYFIDSTVSYISQNGSVMLELVDNNFLTIQFVV